MDNLLFFYIKKSSFVQKDITLLAEKYRVYGHAFGEKPKWQLPFQWASQLWFILTHMRKADVWFVMFSGYISLLPALFAKLSGKSCIVIAGGMDCCYYPVQGYGNYTRQPLKWATVNSYRLAKHIVVVHESLARYTYTFDDSVPPRQGIYNLTPHLKTPFSTIFNGYDSSFWTRNTTDRDPLSFCTVALIGTPRDFAMKGIPEILALARQFPQLKINVAGVKDPGLFVHDPPPNVTFFGPKNAEELVEFYNKHAYYFQLSYSEGFPNALSEAMLCGCIPIGSRVNGIPTIIGDTGYLLEKNDASLLTSLMHKVLADGADEIRSVNARNRVATNFTAEMRQNNFFTLLQQLRQSAGSTYRYQYDNRANLHTKDGRERSPQR